MIVPYRRALVDDQVDPVSLLLGAEDTSRALFVGAEAWSTTTRPQGRGVRSVGKCAGSGRTPAGERLAIVKLTNVSP